MTSDPDPIAAMSTTMRRQLDRRPATSASRREFLQCLVDRVLTPLNQWASRQWLREARQKVWHNAVELQRARVAGPDVYVARLAELEELSAARIADLRAPGQVLLRLAVSGFGVALSPQRTVPTGPTGA